MSSTILVCSVCSTQLIPDTGVCTSCKHLYDLFMSLHEESSLVAIYLYDFIQKGQDVVNDLASVNHPLLTQSFRWEIETYVHGVRISYRHADNVMTRFPVILEQLKQRAKGEE